MALTAAQLNTIYQNVLFRSVDTAGIQFFANRTDISDAQVRQQIELSPEASTFVSPIVRLYQEVLGRVPDAAGLRFFSNQLRAGTSLDNVAQQLVSSAEFTAKSTAVSGAVDATDLANTNQLVTDAFQSILGRTPASSEFAFFQGRTPAQILSAIAGSPEASSTNAAGVVTFLDGVAQGTYNTGTLNNQTSPGGGSPNAVTFALTAGADVVPNGSTVVNGVISSNQGETTLQVTDTINTAAGATLNAQLIGTVASAGLNSTGVTTLNLRVTDIATASDARSIDVAGLTGLTKIGIAGSTVVGTNVDSLTINNIAKGTQLQLGANSANQDIVANYVAAATNTAADTVNLAFTGGQNGQITIGNGFETAAITTSGTGNREFGLAFNGAGGQAGAATLKTVTVGGSGDFRVDSALDASVTSFDASGNSGAVNVRLGTTQTTLNAKGGSGTADVVTLQGSSSTGAGVTISGFETVAFNSSANVSINTTNITGVTAFGIAQGTAGTANNSVTTLTNVAAGINAVNFLGTVTDGTGSGSFNGLNYQLANAGGTSDALTINVNNGGTATTGTFTTGAITADGIETLTINTADARAVTLGGISDTNANNSTIKLAGAANLNAGTIADGKIVSLDSAGVTGTLTLTDNVTGNHTFTGGNTVTNLTVGNSAATGAVQTFNLGTANDVIVHSGGGTGQGIQNFNLGTGTDSFSISSSAAVTGTINLNGGDGTDTLIVTGNGAQNTTIGAAATGGFSGFEAIQLNNITTAATLTLNVASGYVGTEVITNGGVQNNITYHVVSGGSANISAVTQNGGGIGTLTLSGEASGNETLTASKAVATTLLGLGGADRFDLVAGHTAAHTVAQGIGASGTFAAPTTNTISTSGFDVVTNSLAGDKIAVTEFAGGTNFSTTVGTSNVVNGITVGNNTATVVRGTYDSTANNFVGSATGADSLVVYDSTNTGATVTLEAVVVVGHISVTAANTGVLTIV